MGLASYESRDRKANPSDEQAATADWSAPGSEQRFTDRGAIPPVATFGDDVQAPSASDLAFGPSSNRADTAPMPPADLTTTQPAPVNSNPLADDLYLNRHPTTARGPAGAAAWVLDAMKLGFITVYESSQKELKQLVADDKVVHAPDGDVKVDDVAILLTLVELLRKRIGAWRSGGAKHPFALGGFIRSDAAFVGKYPRLVHREGAAMDLGDLNMGKSAADVIAILDDLPPGQMKGLFRDTRDSIHIDNRGDGYGFGLPCEGEFFPRELALEEAQQREEQAHGADHTATLHAEGLIWGNGWLYSSTATWQGDKWVWTTTQKDSDILHLIRSGPLKAALKNLRKPGAPPAAPQAAPVTHGPVRDDAAR